VTDQLIPAAALETLHVPLQVGARTLRSGSNGHGLATEDIGRRHYLVNVGSLLIVAGHQHAHSIGPTIVSLGGGLHLVAQIGNQTTDRKLRVVGVPEGHALRPHVLAHLAGICRQSCDGHAHVRVHRHDLPLERVRVLGIAAQGDERRKVSALQSHGGRSLLHRLHGVLHLEETTLWTPHRRIAVVLIPKHPAERVLNLEIMLEIK